MAKKCHATGQTAELPDSRHPVSPITQAANNTSYLTHGRPDLLSQVMGRKTQTHLEMSAGIYVARYWLSGEQKYRDVSTL
ncbi:hypothetical protein CEXT_475611 [Caerostris extrusa]|uniref:Uncharacterized protein n=1 Tax=Caerostris extrusa TaxID=172846 RepID=A0AAV4QFA4_CAEEX|nr:hypothetical protein CEXT_475611 [Caerostris extrusa]